MTTNTPSRALHVALWTVQLLLSSSLIWAASVKLLQSPDELSKMWPWTISHRGLVLITGIIDLLAGLGLILPGILLRNQRLTVFTAYGIALLMIAASVFHLSRGEGSSIGVNFVFAAMAVFIAWGRQKKAQ